LSFIVFERSQDEPKVTRISRIYSHNIMMKIAQSNLWAAGWMIGGFKSRQGLKIFLFTTAYRRALGPTQPPIQWVPGSSSLEVKRPGHEADHSLLSSAEVKNA
jgi:hypothetical protein